MTDSDVLDVTTADAVRSKRAPVSTRQLRYEIWEMQARTGHDTCFGTQHRFVCEEQACPWKSLCQGLRAEWIG